MVDIFVNGSIKVEIPLATCDLCLLETSLLDIPVNDKGELYCPACEELFP